MTKRLVVRIARLKLRGSIEEEVFDESPITVGSVSGNALRLEHPLVSPHQGVVTFTPTAVHYMDHKVATATIVDGVPALPETPVPLQPDTLVQVGPFRFCVELEPVRAHDSEGDSEKMTFEEDVMGVIRAVASVARGAPIDSADTLASFVTRAVKLADIVSAVVVELRARHGRGGMRRFESSPLRNSWDAYEISDYLLDPLAPDTRLAELKRLLMELTQAPLPSPTPEGRA
jgi:hypothetical protein